LGIFDFFRSAPSPEKFARIVLRAFADAGYGEPLRYDAGDFRLVSEDGKSVVHNLHNVYREYQAAPRGGREAILDTYVRAFMTAGLPATFAEARASLLPLLRGRATLEYLRFKSPAGPDNPATGASMPFSADSVVMLAYDSELSIQTLTGDTLRDWGVSFDEALAAAIDNLRDATVSHFVQIEAGVYAGAWDDAYETSRILFPDIFYQLNVGGEPLVMLPTRNRLLVASSNDAGAQLRMLALAHEMAEEGRIVSALMYRFEHGKPVEHVPDDADVLASLEELKRSYLAEDYASQKRLLDEQFDQDGTDVFVASYQLLRKQADGSTVSYGVWTESVDTLLPEVDLVALSTNGDDGADGETKLVSWAELRAQVAELRLSEAGYPARYRLKTFPSKELIGRLASAEL
jgi:hypothetical protein